MTCSISALLGFIPENVYIAGMIIACLVKEIQISTELRRLATENLLFYLLMCAHTAHILYCIWSARRFPEDSFQLCREIKTELLHILSLNIQL